MGRKRHLPQTRDPLILALLSRIDELNLSYEVMARETGWSAARFYALRHFDKRPTSYIFIRDVATYLNLELTVKELPNVRNYKRRGPQKLGSSD